jgi:hypothetical protein
MASNWNKLKIMKLIYLKSKSKKLLIAELLLLGCVMAGGHELMYSHVTKKELSFKNGQLEHVVIYDTINCKIESKSGSGLEIDEDMWYLESNAYWQVD